MDTQGEISLRERIRLNLVSAMKSAGINQVKLAEILGISKGTVNNWTRGNNSPDVDIVPRICDALGISILDLYSPAEIEAQTSAKKITTLVQRGAGRWEVSESEYRIVAAYRVASEADRGIIDNIVDRYAPAQSGEAVG